MPAKPTYEDLERRVAELERAIEDLGEEEQRYRTIFERNRNPIAIIDRNGRYLEANGAFLEFVEKTREELLGMSAFDFSVPAQRNRQEQSHRPAWDKGGTIETDYWINNAVKTLELTITPFTYQGTDAVIGVGKDVTDRRKAEEALKAIEWLIKASPEEEHYPSQDYGDLTALNTERTVLDSIGPEVLGDTVKGYLELLGTSAAVYERNGDYAQGIFASGYCRMLDSASRRLCGTDDNAAALASGKWLCHESCWTDASKVAVQTGKPVDVECHGGIRIFAVPIRVNREVVGILNFGYGDPPKDRLEIQEIAKKYEVDPEELSAEAERYESRPKFIVEIAKNRLVRTARLIGALVESKQAQAELQKEREKLNVTLQSIGDGVITTDVEGRVALLNTVARDLTGWEQDEAVGRRLDEVFHIVNEHTRERCENPVDKVLETGGIVGLANDTLLLARDGTEKVIADSGAPIVDAGGDTVGVVLVFRDITEKIRLESELRHAHKMEAIGNLAGGIAHEFNNVLGIIIGNAELAIGGLESWNPVSENLNEIKMASLRAKDVVKQLLAFSRKMETKREPVDVGIIVKETLKLLRAAIPSYIRIQEVIPPGVDHVAADPTQIHQLLINLCNNAAQAMSENGGQLTIELSNVELDYEAASKHPDLKPGAYVRFSVCDTGCGIPVDLLDRVFDPYFTTKDVGKGTGMGLAVVHGIVKAHQGAIDVESRVGKGTAFHVYFPSSEQKARQHEAEMETLPGGSERILLVDDEPAIVRLCEIILRQLGYSVHASTDPAEIKALFEEDPYRYDLVISDMTMPYMTGDRLAEEFIRLRPDVPIIVCTGFSEKISPEKAEELGIKELIQKPIMKNDLARTVRRILDKSKS